MARLTAIEGGLIAAALLAIGYVRFESGSRASNVRTPSPIPRPLLEEVGLALGEPANPRWTIFQVLDYECPPCHAQEPACAEYRQKNPHVDWRIVQFPLPFHSGAEKMAEAALSTAKQGGFPDAHKKLMAGVKVSVNPGELPAARRLLRLSKALPIEATPTFIAFGPGRVSAMSNDAKSLFVWMDRQGS